jgi:hypothetical protein
MYTLLSIFAILKKAPLTKSAGFSVTHQGMFLHGGKTGT